MSAILVLILVILLNPLSSAAAPAPSWQVEWSRTLEGGSKEGQVNVYMYVAWANAIQESNVFQKAFPTIRLSLVTGGPSQLAQRVMAERRANKYLVDVLNVGFSASRMLFDQKMLDPLKPALILPEVVDESKWWQGKHHYLDPERQYAFRYVGAPQYGSISYNTKLVKEGEFKSLWDFCRSEVERQNHCPRYYPDRPRERCHAFLLLQPKNRARNSLGVCSGKWISLCSATAAWV